MSFRQKSYLAFEPFDRNRKGAIKNRERRVWLAVAVPVSEATEELVSAMLFAEGAIGTERRADRLVAYFANQDTAALRRNLTAAIDRLRRHGAGLPEIHPEVGTVFEEDWHSQWRRFFKPVHIADCFLVRPPWETAPAGTTAIELVIEPKQAFGTGTHPTTQLMLAAIARRRNALPARALDVGTGSGILAIAHAKVGPVATSVIGLDIDPVAVKNARENAALNGVSAKCRFFAGSIEALAGVSLPLIYANLQKQIILPLLPELCRLVQPGGEVWLSGLLREEKQQVRQALSDFPLEVSECHVQDEWILLECTRYAPGHD